MNHTNLQGTEGVGSSVGGQRCAEGAPSGCSPTQSAALTAIPGIVSFGSNDGHLRGYSTEDGKILWDF